MIKSKSGYAVSARILTVILLCTMAGCACLEPDRITGEAGHQSHASQHFGEHTTRYGRNMVGLSASWDRGKWHTTVREAYSVEGDDGSCAPAEVFEAWVGFDIWSKH